MEEGKGNTSAELSGCASHGRQRKNLFVKETVIHIWIYWRLWCICLLWVRRAVVHLWALRPQPGYFMSRFKGGDSLILNSCINLFCRPLLVGEGRRATLCVVQRKHGLWIEWTNSQGDKQRYTRFCETLNQSWNSFCGHHHAVSFGDPEKKCIENSLCLFDANLVLRLLISKVYFELLMTFSEI